MAISIGIGTQGPKTRVLRCTFGGAQLWELRQRWGNRPRLSFTAVPKDGGRWGLALRANEAGNIGVVKRLGDREYLTYVWVLGSSELEGMAPASRSHNNVLVSAWGTHVLDVVVDGTTVRQPVERAMRTARGERVIITKLKQEHSTMKKSAIYELEKSTPGSVRYGWVSGDKGMGTIYIRKEEISGEPPKRINVNITAAD